MSKKHFGACRSNRQHCRQSGTGARCPFGCRCLHRFQRPFLTAADSIAPVRWKGSTMTTATKKTVLGDFTVEYLGIDSPSYFPGYGAAFTTYTIAFTESGTQKRRR